MTRSDPITLNIPAADGLTLAASLFRGRRQTDGDGPYEAGRSPGTIIVTAAVGNVRESYAEFARFLAEAGWNVVTFDYRGLGGSRRPWKQATGYSMLDWGEKDLTGVIDWVKDQLDPARIVLVGHSIGGQIAALANNYRLLDALIGVSAQRGYWRYWPGLRKYIVYLFFRAWVPWCLKRLQFLPLNWVGLESLPAGAARDWARWGLIRDYLDHAGRALHPRYTRFTAPVLAMSFTDDRSLAPKRAVDVLFSREYDRAPVTRWHIDPGDVGLQRLGHSGFFQRNGATEHLWRATLDWILTTGRPEQRDQDREATATFPFDVQTSTFNVRRSLRTDPLRLPKAALR